MAETPLMSLEEKLIAIMRQRIPWLSVESSIQPLAKAVAQFIVEEYIPVKVEVSPV